MAALDQLFVNLKHWLVALFPAPLQPFVAILVSIVAIVATFPFLFAITTVIERKALGRIQNRPGPNRVGIPLTKIRLAGFGQFAADGIKAMTKEDVVDKTASLLIKKSLSGVSDGVSSATKPTTMTFPYLADPN